MQAACRKIIETVETVFVQYTEFRYTSHAAADTPFVPLVLQYMPDGLAEVDRQQNANSLYILYVEEGITRYFDIDQDLLTENSGSVYIVDTENARQETVWIHNEAVTFIYKEKRIHFIWLHHAYRISGQTNLSKEETIKILEQITYVQE